VAVPHGLLPAQHRLVRFESQDSLLTAVHPAFASEGTGAVTLLGPAFQCAEEASLQFALDLVPQRDQAGVGDLVGAPVVEQVGEHAPGHVTVGEGELMVVDVCEQAAVAGRAAGGFVGAGALLQHLSGGGEDLVDAVGALAWVQVAAAAGQGVVDDQVAALVAGVGVGHGGHHGVQVVQGAAVDAGEPGHECGFEADDAFLGVHGGHRQQDAQCLGTQGVCEQQGYVFDVVAAPLRTPGPVVAAFVVVLAAQHPGQGLDRVTCGGAAAGPTHLEGVDRHLFAGEGDLGGAVGALSAQVESAHRGLAGELHAEGVLGVAPGTFLDLVGGDVHGHGCVVVLAAPVVVVVAAECVLAAVTGVHAGGFQDQVQAGTVTDEGVLAAWAGRGVVLGVVGSHVSAGRADAPGVVGLPGPGADVQAVDLVTKSPHVVVVSGGELGQGHAGGASVFTYFGAEGPVAVGAFLVPGEGGLQVDGAVDERVV